LIEKRVLWQFLSGRLLALVVLIAFQAMTARLLPVSQYARYALVLAMASLLQTLTACGLPRVSARFLSRTDEGVSFAALGLGVLAAIRPAFSTAWPFWLAGAGYALAGALQMDADGAAQALSLQRASRRGAVGEPLARLIGTALLASLGLLDVETLLVLSMATSALAGASLLIAVVRRLNTGDDGGDDLDWREVRRVAAGGYAGTLSWLMFSPAVVRLIASRVLPLEVFAGFSFVQTLAVSVQRYAPSFILFPLIEPLVMAGAARKRGRVRLAAMLSLLVKIDSLAVGAAIVGVSAAGGTILGLLTHGRYADAGVFLPLFLAGAIANASHRSYEIGAVALGVSGALSRSLVLSALWVGVAILSSPMWGVWPLLICPLTDALSRFWLVQRAADRVGGPRLLDGLGLAAIVFAALGLSLGDSALIEVVHAGSWSSVGIGASATVLFLLLLPIVQPLRRGEAAILVSIAPKLRSLLRLFAARRARLRVVVLTPRGRGGTGGVDRLMDSLRPLFDRRSDLEVRFLTTRGEGRRLSLFVTLHALVRLSAACLLRRVDAIHVNLGAEGGCYRKMALLALPRLLRTPYVLHLHGSGFEAFWKGAPPFVRARIDRLFFNAARIIVLGEVWRRLVLDHVPEADTRIVVLPNASPQLDTAPIDPGETIQILFLGELSRRKGVDVLVEALAMLDASAPWRAAIAGNGDVQAIRQAVASKRLSDRVDVSGWAAPTAVERSLRQSHILVLPSFEENLPMAVIEAFAAGLAVVTTPVGAIPDILHPGVTGLLVPPGDTAALAAALDLLIGDAALREGLGGAAQGLHAERLCLSRYELQLEAVWRTAAKHL
jgi:glycosyltransferase involved in cell wall biosynthesis